MIDVGGERGSRLLNGGFLGLNIAANVEYGRQEEEKGEAHKH